jgi:hypothetical protein
MRFWEERPSRMGDEITTRGRRKMGAISVVKLGQI